MNNNHFLARRVSGYESYDEIGPITGVAVIVQAEDGEREILAEGSDTSGYVLEVSCPYNFEVNGVNQGQTIANNIFSSLRGKTYKGFRATGARFDPMAELGDAVTVNGTYSMLGYRRVNFGPNHTSEIAAPGENAVEHEYSAGGKGPNEQRRANAETWSLIGKKTDEILLKVEGADGKGGLAGQVALISTKVDNIKLSVSNGPSSSTLKLMSGSTELSSAEIKITGMVTFDSLSGTPTGTTRINGGWIDADTLNVNAANIRGAVTAQSLLGGTVGLLVPAGYDPYTGQQAYTSVGALGITGTSDGVGLQLATYAQYGGIKIQAGGGNVWIESDTGASLMLGDGNENDNIPRFSISGILTIGGSNYGSALPTTRLVAGRVFFLKGG